MSRGHPTNITNFTSTPCGDATVPNITGSTTQKQCFKTRLCHFHLLQRCTRGVQCLFAHSGDEVRYPPDLSKTKMCVKWKRGCCRHGNHCTYAHGATELRPLTGNALGVSKVSSSSSNSPIASRVISDLPSESCDVTFTGGISTSDTSTSIAKNYSANIDGKDERSGTSYVKVEPYSGDERIWKEMPKETAEFADGAMGGDAVQKYSAVEIIAVESKGRKCNQVDANPHRVDSNKLLSSLSNSKTEVRSESQLKKNISFGTFSVTEDAEVRNENQFSSNHAVVSQVTRNGLQNVSSNLVFLPVKMEDETPSLDNSYDMGYRDRGTTELIENNRVSPDDANIIGRHISRGNKISTASHFTDSNLGQYQYHLSGKPCKENASKGKGNDYEVCNTACNIQGSTRSNHKKENNSYKGKHQFCETQGSGQKSHTSSVEDSSNKKSLPPMEIPSYKELIYLKSEDVGEEVFSTAEKNTVDTSVSNEESGVGSNLFSGLPSKTEATRYNTRGPNGGSHSSVTPNSLIETRNWKTRPAPKSRNSVYLSDNKSRNNSAESSVTIPPVWLEQCNTDIPSSSDSQLGSNVVPIRIINTEAYGAKQPSVDTNSKQSLIGKGVNGKSLHQMPPHFSTHHSKEFGSKKDYRNSNSSFDCFTAQKPSSHEIEVSASSKGKMQKARKNYIEDQKAPQIYSASSKAIGKSECATNVRCKSDESEVHPVRVGPQDIRDTGADGIFVSADSTYILNSLPSNSAENYAIRDPWQGNNSVSESNFNDGNCVVKNEQPPVVAKQNLPKLQPKHNTSLSSNFFSHSWRRQSASGTASTAPYSSLARVATPSLIFPETNNSNLHTPQQTFATQLPIVPPPPPPPRDPSSASVTYSDHLHQAPKSTPHLKTPTGNCTPLRLPIAAFPRSKFQSHFPVNNTYPKSSAMTHFPINNDSATSTSNDDGLTDEFPNQGGADAYIMHSGKPQVQQFYYPVVPNPTGKPIGYVTPSEQFPILPPKCNLHYYSQMGTDATDKLSLQQKHQLGDPPKTTNTHFADGLYSRPSTAAGENFCLYTDTPSIPLPSAGDDNQSFEYHSESAEPYTYYGSGGGMEYQDELLLKSFEVQPNAMGNENFAVERGASNWQQFQPSHCNQYSLSSQASLAPLATPSVLPLSHHSVDNSNHTSIVADVSQKSYFTSASSDASTVKIEEEDPTLITADLIEEFNGESLSPTGRVEMESGHNDNEQIRYRSDISTEEEVKGPPNSPFSSLADEVSGAANTIVCSEETLNARHCQISQTSRVEQRVVGLPIMSGHPGICLNLDEATTEEALTEALYTHQPKHLATSNILMPRAPAETPYNRSNPPTNDRLTLQAPSPSSAMRQSLPPNAQSLGLGQSLLSPAACEVPQDSAIFNPYNIGKQLYGLLSPTTTAASTAPTTPACHPFSPLPLPMASPSLSPISSCISSPLFLACENVFHLSTAYDTSLRASQMNQIENLSQNVETCSNATYATAPQHKMTQNKMTDLSEVIPSDQKNTTLVEEAQKDNIPQDADNLSKVNTSSLPLICNAADNGNNKNNFFVNQFLHQHPSLPNMLVPLQHHPQNQQPPQYIFTSIPPSSYYPDPTHYPSSTHLPCLMDSHSWQPPEVQWSMASGQSAAVHPSTYPVKCTSFLDAITILKCRPEDLEKVMPPQYEE